MSLRLSTRMPMIIIGLAVVAVLVTGAISYTRSEQALEKAAFSKLEAIQEARITELNSYLHTVEEELRTMATNDMAIDAVSAIEDAFGEMGDQAKVQVRKLYINDNPNPAGEKQKLDDAGDGSSYSKAHAHYHPWFRQLLESRGYYDIFLVNEDGEVVYSVFKEADFASNLLNGQWANTDLAKAFKQVANKPLGTIAFTDFAPYAPSNNAPASFMATPLYERSGAFHGAIIFQMPVQRINNVMNADVGLGKTGEAYLVGTDLMMRSDARLSKESTILKRKVDTEQVRRALKGEDSVMDTYDYRNTHVLAAYGPIKFHGVTWAAIAEIEMAEVDIPVLELRDILAGVIVIIALIVGAIGYFLSRSVTRPVGAMTGVMGELAKDNLDVEVPYTDKTDELGEMAQSVNHFKLQMIKVKELEAEQEAQKRKADAERKAAMIQMADTFEASVGQVVNTVTSAATELQASANQMSATAQETSAQATTVAAAAEEASANVQTVASAAEELASSEGEISTHVHKSSQVADHAAKEAADTKSTVENMVEQVGKINAIVDLINDIAGQTNLLALNATIEAARAGDAGKGFAVVASEVKGLAQQTSNATDEIASQIGQVQQVTHAAATAISSIGTTITEIDEIANSIAAAVEEQTAATREIARNVDQASQGTAEVSSNIQGVEAAAGETGAAATQISNSASDLSRQAEVLREEVKRFLDQVRADNSSMTLMEWDESLRTGNTTIDNEHRAFIDMLNTYYGKMMSGAGADVVDEMLEKFSRHFADHLNHEEQEMRRIGYAELDKHAQSHRDFMNRLKAIQEQHAAGQNVSVDFLNYMATWLREHTMKYDKLFVAAMK